MTIPRAPKGTDDILGPSGRVWRRALVEWEELTELYGYDLILTPIIEPTELFSRGVGEDTEVVQKQMYTFEDRAGRSLTLRPEATASVVRAYLNAGTGGLFKAAYSGPMFRYEQPQQGRRRQFYQLGVEYLGEPSPLADVEVIQLGYRFLTDTLGIDDLDVALNTLGDPDDRERYRVALVQYLEERRGNLSEDSQRRIVTNPLRVLDSKVDAPLLGDAPSTLDYLSDDSSEAFDTVTAALEEAEIPVTLDSRLVRGLDYYSRTVFEYIPRSYEAAQSSVGGGGRYDGLAELIGGRRTPAVGLALGLERALLAAGRAAESGPVVFAVVAESGLWGQARDLVDHLRSGGVSADLDLGRRSVKSQFRSADRRNARFAVVIGSEWHEGQVTVKTLGTGEQSVIAREDISSWISR